MVDQKAIVEGLQRALANGTGSLTDLENLLKLAEQDVIKARAEEAEAKRKAEEKAEQERKARMAAHGQLVTDLANRLLQGQVTAEDCAFVMNEYARVNKINFSTSGESVVKGMAAAAKFDEEMTKLKDALEQLFGPDAETCKSEKCQCHGEKDAPSDADTALADFLRSMRL